MSQAPSATQSLRRSRPQQTPCSVSACRGLEVLLKLYARGLVWSERWRSSFQAPTRCRSFPCPSWPATPLLRLASFLWSFDNSGLSSRKTHRFEPLSLLELCLRQHVGEVQTDVGERSPNERIPIVGCGHSFSLRSRRCLQGVAAVRYSGLHCPVKIGTTSISIG